jgi:hypothetical protein
MRNLRERYTYKEREAFDEPIHSLRMYIVPLLLTRQYGVCDRCGEASDEYDIHHDVYNPMVTINELKLLCVACHYAITDYTHRSTRRLRNRTKL